MAANIRTFEQAERYVNSALAPGVRKRLENYLKGIGVDERVPVSYVYVAKLPIVIQNVCDYANGCYQKIGKIFGLYNPISDAESIDAATVNNDDPERQFLGRNGMRIPSGDRVLAEELAHKMQRKTGALWRYMKLGKIGKDIIEGAAATVADRISGKTGIYEYEKALYRELERRVGKRDAFLGTDRAVETAKNILKEYALGDAA